MRGLAAAVLFLASGASAAGVESLLQNAASAYREGRLTDALGSACDVLEADPRNAVAKNYIWTITQEIQKKRPRLAPGEKERDAALARKALDDRRARTEKIMDELQAASRQSRDLRSPTGLLSALGDLGQSLGPDGQADLGGAQGQVYMGNILNNLQAALERDVFVSRKDHLRVEGYLAFYKQDWPRAVSSWEKAVKEDPSDVQVQNDLNSLKTMLARERERDELKELVAQAETYQQTGLYAQAVEAWSEVLRRDPRRPGAVEAVAVSRVALEKTRQLRKLDAMNEEAAAFYKDGRRMKAAEIWLEALQLDPTYQKARVWLKLVGKQLDRPEQAAEAAPAPVRAPAASGPAPSLDEGHAEQLYKKGLMAYAEGQLAEANELWREALAANPGLKKAREALRQGESELSLIKR